MALLYRKPASDHPRPARHVGSVNYCNIDIRLRLPRDHFFPEHDSLNSAPARSSNRSSQVARLKSKRATGRQKLKATDKGQ